MSEPGKNIDEKYSDQVSDSSQDSCQLQIVDEPMSDEQPDTNEVEAELPTQDTSSQYENPRPQFYRDTFEESGVGSMPNTSSSEKIQSPNEMKKRKVLKRQRQLETKEMATKETQTPPIQLESILTIHQYSPTTTAGFDFSQPQYMPSVDMEDDQPPANDPMDGYNPFDVCPMPIPDYTPPPVQRRQEEEKLTYNPKPQNGMKSKETKDM